MARRSPSTLLELAIVGRGRVGTSLARALRAHGHRVQLIAHGELSSIRPASVVLLAVPDRAVDALAASLTAFLTPGTIVAHTAGALDLTVLAGVEKVGALPGSLHPLLAIARRRQSLEGAYAAIDGAPRVRTILTRLARDAGLIPFKRSPARRGRYHLAAVLAANSLAPLLETSIALLIESGIDPSEARKAAWRLAESALQAWGEAGGAEGLTGPIARGDLPTVKRHLQELGARDDDARALYVSLNRIALGLARERRPQPENLDAILRLLKKRRKIPRHRAG